MSRNVRLHERGFTLLEVVIALAILAVSLSALFTVQTSSVNNAARARDTSVATLLARSKLIDIEQVLFDEGFTEGGREDKGDFDDEGHPNIKWAYTTREVEMDLGALSTLCALDTSDAEEGAGCEAMIGSLGVFLEGFMQSVSQSVRLVELTVTWPAGRFENSMQVRSLVSKEDFELATASTNPPQFKPDGSN